MAKISIYLCHILYLYLMKPIRLQIELSTIFLFLEQSCYQQFYAVAEFSAVVEIVINAVFE